MIVFGRKYLLNTQFYQAILCSCYTFCYQLLLSTSYVSMGATRSETTAVRAYKCFKKSYGYQNYLYKIKLSHLKLFICIVSPTPTTKTITATSQQKLKKFENVV